MKCNICDSEITTLRKHLPFWEIILWICFLLIPVIGWILLVIEVAWYFSRKPDRCPICGHTVDFSKIIENNKGDQK